MQKDLIALMHDPKIAYVSGGHLSTVLKTHFPRLARARAAKYPPFYPLSIRQSAKEQERNCVLSCSKLRLILPG